MKRIIFIESLVNQEIADQIADILDETRAMYSIDLASKSIGLEGNNDILHAVKIALQQAGFKIS